MILTVDHESDVPPYEQLRSGIIALVQSGALAAGAKLPTVRALAEQVGLATNTVARAYRELEASEIIETRGRNGSFVRASGDEIHRMAQDAARAYADRIDILGLPRAEALTLVTAALAS